MACSFGRQGSSGRPYLSSSLPCGFNKQQTCKVGNHVLVQKGQYPHCSYNRCYTMSRIICWLPVEGVGRQNCGAGRVSPPHLQQQHRQAPPRHAVQTVAAERGKLRTSQFLSTTLFSECNLVFPAEVQLVALFVLEIISLVRSHLRLRDSRRGGGRRVGRGWGRLRGVVRHSRLLQLMDLGNSFIKILHTKSWQTSGNRARVPFKTVDCSNDVGEPPQAGLPVWSDCWLVLGI